jgi:hypothetical protein
VARKKEPARKGRPPVEIPLHQLEALGMMQGTYEEGAAFFNCTKRTIINRLKKPQALLAYENGKLKGRLNLRRLQWRHANSPTSSAAVNMTIHMSKQPHWLGETDRTALEVSPIELVITRIERVIVDSSSDSDRQGVPPVIEAQAIQGS